MVKGRLDHFDCCHQDLAISLRCGFPVSQEKTAGPLPVITYTLLGIEIDSERMELRLAEDKLTKVKELVARWRKKWWYQRNLGPIVFSSMTWSLE